MTQDDKVEDIVTRGLQHAVGKTIERYARGNLNDDVIDDMHKALADFNARQRTVATAVDRAEVDRETRELALWVILDMEIPTPNECTATAMGDYMYRVERRNRAIAALRKSAVKGD